MTLSKQNWIVRFAYWTERPLHTSVCALFWICAIKGLFIVGGLYALGLGVAWLCLKIYANPSDALFAAGLIVSIVGWIAATNYLDKRWERRERKWTVETSLLLQSVYAIKHRVCPIIRITE